MAFVKFQKLRTQERKKWKTSFLKLFFSDFNTGQVSHLNHSTIKMNVFSHKFRFSPFFIPGKSFESGSPRKFIPAKFFIRRDPRKFIPAKCKYFAVFLNRESFFPRKFLPLKYIFWGKIFRAFSYIPKCYFKIIKTAS